MLESLNAATRDGATLLGKRLAANRRLWFAYRNADSIKGVAQADTYRTTGESHGKTPSPKRLPDRRCRW
jgi:hypothetical protein